MPDEQASPGGDAVQWPADAVEVGRVLGAWGVKGALKVRPHAADPQGLFSTRRWFLAAPSAAGPAAARPEACLRRVLRIAQVRSHGNLVVATVRDILDRDAAQAMAGATVHVARSSFPTPGPDEYYWIDLIGLQVFNRQGVNLGTVVSLQETGPHCVLRLMPPGGAGEERMIPFVSAFVDTVDLAAGRIDVDWSTDY
jgi:16S rRNA processing protein RimM